MFPKKYADILFILIMGFGMSLLMTLIITYIILLLGKKISKKIGTTGIRIIQRIMGLILLVISIQFIINGILLLMESQSKL